MNTQLRIKRRGQRNNATASLRNRSRTQTIITGSAVTFALLGILSGLVPAAQPRAIHPYQGAARNRSIAGGESPRPDRPERRTSGSLKEQVMKNLAEAPFSFQANLGQTDSRARFLSRANGYGLFLTPSGAVFDLKTGRGGSSRYFDLDSPSVLAGKAPVKTTRVSIEMELVGATPGAQLEAQEESPSKVNYFIGNDPEKWHPNIPTYRRVSQANVYPGINLSYYGSQQDLEYDFAITPSASYKTIRLRFKGTNRVYVDGRANGDGFVAKIHETPLDRLMLLRLEIEGLIKEALLPPDSGHDLLVKWDLVIKQADKGNIRPAINQVQEFIAQVNDLLKSGLLPAAQGKIMLDRANEVLDQLSQFEKKKPK